MNRPTAPRASAPALTGTGLAAAVALALAILALAACGDGGAPADDAAGAAAAAAAAEQLSDAQVAVRRLTRALEDKPGDPDLLAERGAMYYENGVYDRAIADFEASIRSDSTRPEVWHLLADAQLDGLRSREGLNTMIFASARFDGRMATQLKLAEFQYILRDYDNALVTLDRAAQLDAGEGEVFFMLGQVFRERGDTARAINAYQRATELDADLLDAWLQLGGLHDALGNPIAERYYNTAVAVARDDATPYRMRADYYARNDRLAEAVGGYDEAIARDAREAEFFYNSALVLMDMDSLARATAQLDRAIALRPTFAQAHFYRGVAAELAGDFGGAATRYQQALNLRPGLTVAEEALSRVRRLGGGEADPG